MSVAGLLLLFALAQDPATQGSGEFTIGPEYSVDPDLTDKGNPKGRQFEFALPLAESRIFKGDDKTLEPDKKPVNKLRTITVYVPAAYKDGDKAPYLVIHDGPGQLALVRNALDNLTIAKDEQRRLPAFVAIAVQNGGDDGKNSERGLEYDTMSDRLARFIHDEVVPAVLARPEIKAALSPPRLHRRPLGPRRHGLQLRRRRRAHDGLVPARPLPPHHRLLRHLRGPAGRRRAGGGVSSRSARGSTTPA